MRKPQSTPGFPPRPPRWVADTGERIYYSILVLVAITILFAVGLLLFPGQ